VNRYLIETWGCQMNVHDSEKMAGLLRPLGYEPTDDPSLAALILLNTCSVREKAAEKLFGRLGRLRHLKRENPELLIGVCGCVAQQEGEAIFRRAPHVDFVMGPRNLARLGEVIARARRDGRSIELARDDDPIVFASGTAARAPGPRAYVTVMEGCNKTCRYCIVPFTRGREVYRTAQEVVAEVGELAAEGYCEIELLGQNVNAYHLDGVDFSALLRMVDRVSGVRRLRFTTSHPGHLSRAIMDAMRDLPSVCNHLHLPAQSGSDAVLRRMNRGYTRDRYLGKIASLRARIPDISFSTDLIVGFPGETDDDFQKTLSLVREAEFDQVYAFAFSQRPGTAAAALSGVLPEEVKQGRLRELLRTQEEIQSRRNAALVGRVFEVLIDGTSRIEDTGLKGRTTCNRIVHVPAAAGSPGRFLRVRITRAHAHSLTGAPLEARPAA
jgi:tRNA-2-methylthio-N6-dimethylallyladenosine synthase